MERKFFVGGNWKMNGSKGKIDEILKNLAESSLSPSTGLFVNITLTYPLACLFSQAYKQAYILAKLLLCLHSGLSTVKKLTEGVIFS